MMSNRNGGELPKKGGPAAKSRPGLIRIWNAMFYSLAGLRAAFQNEAAFRQELCCGLVLVPLPLLLPLPLLHKGYLIGGFFLVLVAELLNSAIEAVVDRVIPEVDEFAKRAKDMGSAAVFLALLNLVTGWIFVLAELFRQ